MTHPAPGLALNNWGHIEHSKDRWQGIADDQPHRRFVKFTAPEWGVRAIARLMITYEKRGANTPRKIINRYAPAGENDTESYVNHVASKIGVEPDDVIDVDRFEIMLPLVETICLHETGVQPKRAVVIEGLRLAGVAETPQASFIKKTGAQVTTGVAVCCAAVSQAAEPVKEAAKSLADYTGAPIIANVSTGLLTVAGIATLAGVAHRYLKHRKGL